MALRIKITPPASEDLVNIEAYIKDEFDNPTAAKRTVKKIMKSYLTLSKSPYAGFSAKGKYGANTHYRVLISGQYVIFYEVNETDNIVNIINIFHSKQNYIRKLFPDFEYDIDEEESSV